MSTGLCILVLWFALLTLAGLIDLVAARARARRRARRHELRMRALARAAGHRPVVR